MDELKDIYDRITYLRHKGMKMKDIAALVDFQPSVFSALYTTVIPAFVKNTERGMAPARRSTAPSCGSTTCRSAACWHRCRR